MCALSPLCSFFFFNDTATTEIYTLSLHDALPILHHDKQNPFYTRFDRILEIARKYRSEEHTSELQSQSNLVCRLLLEKKKTEQALEMVSQLPPEDPDPTVRVQDGRVIRY